jgi:hypothetical protein
VGAVRECRGGKRLDAHTQALRESVGVRDSSAVMMVDSGAFAGAGGLDLGEVRRRMKLR